MIAMCACAPTSSAAAQKHVRWHCPPPQHEPVFRSIIGGLFAENLIPRGSIIDAGANNGDDACYLAERQPNRTVHAIEPMWSNIVRIMTHWSPILPNLVALRGGLGSVDRLVFNALDQVNVSGRTNANGLRVGIGVQVSGVEALAVADTANADNPGTFRVHRIDDLFDTQWRGEQLGFAHFDVEGGELDVIRGGVRTIRRDRPVFTVEVFVHNHAAATRELLQTIADLDYTSYLVEEQCGLPVDCRNVINIPTELHRSFLRSPILDLASTSSRLFRVTAATAKNFAYAAVCAPGALCCRKGPVKESVGRGWWRTQCCESFCVEAWLSNLTGADASAPHAHRTWREQKALARSLFS